MLENAENSVGTGYGPLGEPLTLEALPRGHHALGSFAERPKVVALSRAVFCRSTSFAPATLTSRVHTLATRVDRSGIPCWGHPIKPYPSNTSAAAH